MGVTPPDQIVIHVDMDCFYASCERRRNPELEDVPVVIGMGYEEGKTSGAVATASYEAREHGVESGEAIKTALEKLPVGEEDDSPVYLPVDMEYYESVSAEVMEVLEEYSTVLRVESIDEAYLDVTSETSWKRVEQYASDLKQTISDQVSVPASIGVGPTMNVAKIASDYDKPDGLTVVEPQAVKEFLHPLPVSRLHGVGPVTRNELEELGIKTVEEIASTNPSILRSRFGERGEELYRRSRGADKRQVSPKDDPKSLSREMAFDNPVDEFGEVKENVIELAGAVAERATERGATYQTIGIKVVKPPFEIRTREHSLSGPVNDAELVQQISEDLLEEFKGIKVRKIGVTVSNLSFAEGSQATLDGWADDSGKTTHPRLSTPESVGKERSEQKTLGDFGGE